MLQEQLTPIELSTELFSASWYGASRLAGTGVEEG